MKIVNLYTVILRFIDVGKRVNNIIIMMFLF